MKKVIALVLALVILSVVPASLAENQKIKIAASTTPHAVILEFVKDDLAALGYEPLGCVEAFLIFRDAVFVDDLLVRKAESSLHGFYAVDVGQVITDVLIVQQDNAYFEIFFGNTFSRGCGESTKSKYQNKNDADKLLHEWDPPVKMYRMCSFRMVL